MANARSTNPIRVRTNVRAGMTVYGTPTCAWTQKQRKYLDDNQVPYDFVDCAQAKCPDFVKGYPTLVLTGYTEIPIKH